MCVCGPSDWKIKDIIDGFVKCPSCVLHIGCWQLSLFKRKRKRQDILAYLFALWALMVVPSS